MYTEHWDTEEVIMRDESENSLTRAPRTPLDDVLRREELSAQENPAHGEGASLREMPDAGPICSTQRPWRPPAMWYQPWNPLWNEVAARQYAEATGTDGEGNSADEGTFAPPPPWCPSKDRNHSLPHTHPGSHDHSLQISTLDSSQKLYSRGDFLPQHSHPGPGGHKPRSLHILRPTG